MFMSHGYQYTGTLRLITKQMNLPDETQVSKFLTLGIHLRTYKFMIDNVIDVQVQVGVVALVSSSKDHLSEHSSLL